MQEDPQPQREEAAGPVQPAGERAQRHDLHQQPQDGQEHRAQVYHLLPQEPQR